MDFIEAIDPFVMQLFIVPIIVIGLGVLVSTIVKKFYIAPLITLILNALYEIWYMKHYYPELEISFTSWNIIFPVNSLVFSWLIIWNRKEKNKENKTT